MLFSAAFFLALFVLVIPREEGWYTAVGRHTIYPYLLQYFVIQIIVKLVASIHEYWPDVLILFLAVSAVVIVIVLASTPVRWILSPLIQPEWLGDLLLGADKKQEH
jgi:ABC-type Co2+ transport system permease subunit